VKSISRVPLMPCGPLQITPEPTAILEPGAAKKCPMNRKKPQVIRRSNAFADEMDTLADEAWQREISYSDFDAFLRQLHHPWFFPAKTD
jgi:hypothetical protein